MDEKIDKLIRTFPLDSAPLQEVTYDEETKTWWTSVGLEDEAGDETAFELEFQLVEPADGSRPPISRCAG